MRADLDRTAYGPAVNWGTRLAEVWFLRESVEKELQLFPFIILSAGKYIRRVRFLDAAKCCK